MLTLCFLKYDTVMLLLHGGCHVFLSVTMHNATKIDDAKSLNIFQY